MHPFQPPVDRLTSPGKPFIFNKTFNVLWTERTTHMIRHFISISAFAVLAACGDGNPFTSSTDSSTAAPVTAPANIPASILNDLESISFDPDTNTLTVAGLTQDGVPVANEYRHVPTTYAPGSENIAPFAVGFQTFTAQNDALGRHVTAFVASRDGVQAGVVMTGGQFNRFFGGSYFDRTGAYVAPTAPDGGFDVTYVGRYAAGLNSVGPVTDLITPAGVDPDVDTPAQTAYIRGLVFVNVDINDMSVEGEIYDRTAVIDDGGTPGFLDLTDLVLVEGSLLADGSFTGNVERDQSDTADSVVGVDIGDFAGVIGGANGEFIAGGTTVEDFEPSLTNEIEYGVFVLDLCTAASADPVCVNALSP